MSTEPIIVTCECGATAKARPAKDGSAKTPMRWCKNIDGSFMCHKCREAKYITRTIRCEVSGLADSETRTLKEFVGAAYDCSRACNRGANWLLQRLFAIDPATDPTTWTKTAKGSTVLPALPEFNNCYSEMTRAFPEISPSVITQLASSVRRYYCKERFEVLVALSRSTRSYRSTALPIPIPMQAWKFIVLPDGFYGAQLAVSPGKSWKVKLRIDANRRSYVTQIMEGVAPFRGTATLKLISREMRSGERKGTKIQQWTLLVSGRFPRKRQRQNHQEITLQLGNDAKCLWVGQILESDRDDDFWEFPAVRLKERIVRHAMRDKRRQIDDSQMPRTISRRAQKRLKESRTAHCDTHQAFVAKEIEQQIAALVRRCVSRGVTSVDYDITDRGWTKSFPWYRLREKLAIALENEAIGLHLIGAEEAVTASARPIGEMESHA